MVFPILVLLAATQPPTQWNLRTYTEAEVRTHLPNAQIVEPFSGSGTHLGGKLQVLERKENGLNGSGGWLDLVAWQFGTHTPRGGKTRGETYLRLWLQDTSFLNNLTDWLRKFNGVVIFHEGLARSIENGMPHGVLVAYPDLESFDGKRELACFTITFQPQSTYATAFATAFATDEKSPISRRECEDQLNLAMDGLRVRVHTGEVSLLPSPPTAAPVLSTSTPAKARYDWIQPAAWGFAGGLIGAAGIRVVSGRKR